jgi:hypothetical protein
MPKDPDITSVLSHIWSLSACITCVAAASHVGMTSV